MTQRQIIGVLGGMGPQATCDLFQKLIDCTPAKIDQEHMHIVIDNNPGVPDRTGHILHGRSDPTPVLVEGALRLKHAGCGFIIIPCNTAHFYADAIEKQAGIPVLSMIEATARAAATLLPAGAAVGVMATSGTLQLGLYHRALERVGLRALAPDDEYQLKVTDIIYGPQGVKAGYRDQALRSKARDVAGHLITRGARAVIAGCTEIPLVLADGDIDVPVLDATLLLAKAAVEKATE